MRQFQLVQLLLSWLFFAVAIGYVFGWLAGGQEYVLASKLRDHSETAAGQISSVTNGDALNSPSVSYSYSINGETLYGYSQVPASKASRLGPGASVRVMYLADDPKKSGIDVEGMSESAMHSIKIACVLELVFGSIFAAMLYGRLRGGSLGSFRQGFAANDSSRSGLGIQRNGGVGLLVIGIMLTAGLTMLFAGALPDYSRASALAASSKQVTAQITGVYHPPKRGHRYAEYTFQLDGTYYHGQTDYDGHYGDRGPIQIYYLPSDPSYSNASPANKFANARLGVIFCCVWNAIAGTIFVVVLKSVLKGRSVS